MNLLLPFLLISLLAVLTWTMGLVTKRASRWRLFGLSGAWTATLVLAALWKPDAVPWVSASAKEVFLVWLGSIAILGAAVASGWRIDDRGSRLPLGCAVLCLASNIAAVLRFLWEATVGAGGV